MDEWLPVLGKMKSSNLPIKFVSGKKKQGIVELQKEICSLIPPKPIDKTPKATQDRDGMVFFLIFVFVWNKYFIINKCILYPVIT
jgi:hypothetical protein